MGATIKDIAERTGLGLATISKYLNGGHVLDKNRIAIEQAIKELDFTVNEFARGLKTNQSKMVGAIIPQLNNIFMTSIITIIEEKLRAAGYGVLVCDTGKNEEWEREAFQFLIQKKVDGIILLTSSTQGEGVEAAIQCGIPTVLIDRKIDRLSDKLDMVLVDNFSGSYGCIEYFIQKGHRKIGILLGDTKLYTPKIRLEGYKAALAKYNLPIQKKWIAETDFSLRQGYEAMRQMLEQKERVTAVLATNGDMTLGAVLAIRDCGLSIPEDISVIGFDNEQLAKVHSPQLTMVVQPLEDIGQRAAERILERMNQKETIACSRTDIFPVKLMERGSVGNPPSDNCYKKHIK